MIETIIISTQCVLYWYKLYMFNKFNYTRTIVGQMGWLIIGCQGNS